MIPVKGYSEMKDSGIPWIGQIPSHWKLGKVKNAYTSTKTIVGNDVDSYERLALTLNGVIKRSKNDDNGLQPERFETYQILRENELVFKLIDLQNVSTSRVGRSPYTGIVSPAYIVLHAKLEDSTKYGEYYFLSMWMNQIFNQLGADGVRSNIGTLALLNLPYLIVPRDEQSAIAAYLDEKCSKIDEIIASAKASIEDYKQWKTSIIYEAVTKGLDPDAEMKDSGIEWIGKIPKGWKISKIKTILENVSVKNHPDAEVLSLYRDLGVLPKNSRDDNHNVTSEDTAQYKFVEVGNLVINKMKAWQGSLAVSSYEGIVSPAYYVCRFRNNSMEKNYIHHLLRCKVYAQEFEKLSTGMRIGQWDLGIKDFMRIPVLIPPIEEQNRIAEYIDATCSSIDILTQEKERLILDLESYKKSLIYEVVTGKRRVS